MTRMRIAPSGKRTRRATEAIVPWVIGMVSVGCQCKGAGGEVVEGWVAECDGRGRGVEEGVVVRDRDVALGRAIGPREDTMEPVHLQVFVGVLRGEWEARFRGPDPRSRVVGVVHTATNPVVTIMAEDISRHAVLKHPTPLKKSEVGVAVMLGLIVATSQSRRDRNVTVAIGVHDEDFGAGHLVAEAKTDPGVGDEAVDLYVDVAMVCFGGFGGDGEAVADVGGWAVLGVEGGGCLGCYGAVSV